ncbi:MAG: alpha-L-arabinofuranosidase [Verrucomicrobiae bacterium]|nr:alpha-L-arabinofuranosidase [Verrucomicrobiae bacterium]
MCLVPLLVGRAPAQADFLIYTDRLMSGWQDWSWAPRDLTNTSPVRSGSRSIRVSASPWQAISFWHEDWDTTLYTNFSFWAHGGTSGGQRLQVYAELSGVPQPAYVIPGSLPANTWQRYAIPLSALGVANKSNLSRLSIQLRNDGSTGTFYLDDVQLDTRPPPALVNLTVTTTQIVAAVDARHFGVNLTMWDPYFDPPHHATTLGLLQEMGALVVRMPGGSLSDEYNWASNTSRTNTWQWQASFPDMVRVTTNLGAQAFVTVNYGSGSPQQAAAWVAYANADPALYGTTNDLVLGVDSDGRDWRTAGYWARLRSLTPAANPDNQFDFLAIGRSAPLGFRYWEIGNECYGPWEYDLNTNPQDPFTYANRASNYFALMKAVDPTIQIGVVVAPGENTFSNQFTALNPAYNPRTGRTNYGWTPILLRRLKALGVTPDFVVHHHYPQWTDPNNPAASPVSDVGLLLSTAKWAADAADLRQQITDYFGAGGEAIELLVTENNSDAGSQGRQSTSLVNALYYADSLGALLKTEFRAMVWWDLRNGTDTNGYFGPELYGWRTYGDLGLINGPDTRHPPFYAARLMQWFARPGDRVLATSTDYPLLVAHAARRPNGAVTLLVVNKSLTTNLVAQIRVQGFSPASVATVRSYGIPQDEAARTNGPAAARDIAVAQLSGAGANFVYDFPPLSLTLFTLNPGLAPTLQIAPPGLQTPGQLVLQLQGEPDVPYVIQTSTNLTDWWAVATNRVSGPATFITNAISAADSARYWRALWQP